MSRSTKKIYTTLWNNYIKEEWSNVPLQNIKTNDVKRWFNRIDLSSAYGNHILHIMRSLCDFAVEDNKLLSNLIVKVSKKPVSESDRRYLNVNQADALLDAAEQYNIQTEVDVLLTLGLRLGEMAGIKIKDLDVSRNRLRIQRTIDSDRSENPPKNKKSREVPLTPDLLEALSVIADSKNADDYFFTDSRGYPWTTDSWRYPWSKIKTSTGIDDLKTHELRHTAASWAIRSGASVKTIQRMLGHSKAAMTLNVYGHLFDDELDDIMMKVELTKDLYRNTDGTKI